MKNLKIIDFETVAGCSISPGCVFCPYHKMKRKKGIMTDTTFALAIEQLKKFNVQRIHLHLYGDPLVDPKIVERINKMSEVVKLVSISTNAVLLNEVMAHNLVNSKLGELTLALDSLNKDTYELQRRGAKFEVVKENIDRCLNIRKTHPQSKCKIELQVIVTKYNVHELPDYKREYGWLNSSGWGRLRIKEFSTFAGNVEDLAPNGSKARRVTCNKPFNSLTVLWDGTVVLCCRSYEGEPRLGNLHNETLEEIWKGAILEEYRNAMRQQNFKLLNFCKEC